MKQYINIAICDDEERQRHYLKGLTEAWAGQGGYEIQITEFPSAEAFWFQYAERKDYHILLLDIEMPHMNGVELAQQIRAGNETLQIIFITGFPDYMQQGYDVAALHYLMKPVGAEKLAEVLTRAVRGIARSPRTFFLENKGESVRIALQELLYIEALAHGTELVLEKGEGGQKKILRLEASLSISQLESRLQKDFIRCHRSYLVNLKRIERIIKTEIVLDTQERIPLSRRRYAAVNQAFIAYYTKEEP